MRIARQRSFVPVCLILVLAGCEEKDVTAPRAPSVDPVTTPTALRTQDITGTAEFGSRVIITGGETEVTTIADIYTAHFRATVPLNGNVVNTLTLVAKDDADNTSEATTVEILQEPKKPKRLDVALSDVVVDADTGQISVDIQATSDEPIDLSGFPLTLTVSGYALALGPFTATTDAAGKATVEISGLTKTGSGTLAVSSLGVSSANHRFSVVPGVPSALAFAFVPDAMAGQSIGNNGDLIMIAGDDATYTYALTDKNGNAPLAPLSVIVDDPAAFTLDDGFSGNGVIAGLTRAARICVSPRVSGSDVSATPSARPCIEVRPAVTTTFLTASASADVLQAGVNNTARVSLYLRIRDRFNNSLLPDPALGNLQASQLSLGITKSGASLVPGSCDPAAPTTCWTIAAPQIFSDGLVLYDLTSITPFDLDVPGPYSFTLSYDPDGAGGTATANASPVLVVVQQSPDVVPPTVSICQINRDYTATAAPAGIGACPASAASPDVATAEPDCADADPNPGRQGMTECSYNRGESVAFRVHVLDQGGLSELTFSATFLTAISSGSPTVRSRTILFGAGTTSQIVDLVLSVPNNAGVEDVRLVAQAKDLAGNLNNSSPVTLHIMSIDALGRGSSPISAGILNNPEDVAVHPITGDVYIANSSAGEVVRADTLDSVTRVLDTNAGSACESPASENPHAITFDAAGTLHTLTYAGGPNNFRLLRTTDLSGDACQALAATTGAATNIDFDTGANNCTTGGNGLQPTAMTSYATTRAIVRFTATVQDGDTVTLAAKTFEFDTNGSCAASTSSLRCVDVSGGASASQAATALTTAFNTAAGGYATTAGHRAALGPAIGAPQAHVLLMLNDSDALGLQKSDGSNNAIAVSCINGSFVSADASACTTQANTSVAMLSDQRSFVYRVDTPAPSACYLARHAVSVDPDPANFNAMGQGGGLAAISGVSGATGLILLAADRGNNVLSYVRTSTQTLAGAPTSERTARLVDGNTACTAASRPGTTCRLSDPRDMAVTLPATSSTGSCLLVANRGRGQIIAVDLRNGLASPTLTLVAQGFSDVRGLAIDDGPSRLEAGTGRELRGSLLVTDVGTDAVIRIFPSSDPTDCF